MKVVIVGAGGRLGAALMREYRDKLKVTGFNHAQLDLSNLDTIHEKLGGMDFDVLINAAAFTNVDLCEREREQAFRVNGEAPGVLAEICRTKSAKLIHFSTDYVFDGQKREPYTEEDEAKPISVYAESKLAGEKNVLAAVGEAVSYPGTATPSHTVNRKPRHLVVRVSWVFGPDRPSFIDAMIRRAREETHIEAIADKFSTPTYTLDIAEMLPRFFPGPPVARVADPGSIGPSNINDYSGILHFANTGECSWQEYAQWALDCGQKFGIALKAKTVGAAKLKDMVEWIAHRPVYSVLSTAKYTTLTGISPRAWREAVADYISRLYSNK